MHLLPDTDYVVLSAANGEIRLWGGRACHHLLLDPKHPFPVHEVVPDLFKSVPSNPLLEANTRVKDQG